MGAHDDPNNSDVKREVVNRRRILLGSTTLAVASALGVEARIMPVQAQQTESEGATTPTAGQQQRPNILVIMGDDIGYWNISAYNRGMLGYRTPNIDRVGSEGGVFTNAYAQQSCTAGRAAFITGQCPVRTGLTKVGLPGAPEGLHKDDPTIAELLKPLGYTTGQFGKNHLGDRDEFLPTNHGFDEFFGNLYHLNAEEEPENPDYPKSPEFRRRFGPRGVLHAWANPDGTQRIEDTGPLSKKRMETVDEEFLKGSLDFIDRAYADSKPFFVWFNSTRMHIFTHLKPESAGKTGIGLEADGMVEHDGHVGRLLKKLDDLGIANNTIVIYTTDNGAEEFSWPDAGTTPFRGEKNTSWEGGYRIPLLVRWPGCIKPGSELGEIISHEDWLPTLAAAAGVPDVKERLLAGYKAGDRTFKVHLDGYNFMPFFERKEEETPRHEFFYWTDDGNLAALRYDQWKILFLKQEAHGLNVWRNPFTELRAPLIFSLYADPFERADEEAGGYDLWYAQHMFAFGPAQAYTAKYLVSYQEFPPRQKPGSFNVQQAMEKLTQAHQSNN